MTLTNSYQKIAEKKLGSWGYGTLYLRTYAKYNSQDVSNNKTSYSVQARIYNNGGYCYSGNCYNTVQGTKLVDNETLYFTATSEITLGTVTKTVTHNVDGSKSVSVTNTFKCFALDSTTFKANATVDLPQINRFDKAIGLDFDIGSATNISVTRYNENYTRTVVASMGEFSEELIVKGTDTLIVWQPTAASLYEQIPNTNIGTITLITTTYDGDTVVGTTTSTLKCRVTDSNPIINSVSVVDTIPKVASNVIVKGSSNVKFIISATRQNGANITGYSVTEENATTVTGNSNEITVGTVMSNKFVITVTDSRGNTTTSNYTIDNNNYIDYELPKITVMDLVRTGENLDNAILTITGLYFNDTINGTSNAITLKYRYREVGGTWSNYISINHSINTSPFNFSCTLSSTFNADTVYEIEVVVTDLLESGSLSNRLVKAVPLTQHWSDNDGDHYNFNADIQQYGESLIKNPRELLWSGNQTRDGDTIQLSDSIQNYRFLLLRVGNTINHILAPVIPNNTAVRGNCTYTGVNNIELISFTGITGNDFKSITQTRMLIYILKTSGITANTNYTGIVEVWGIR